MTPTLRAIPRLNLWVCACFLAGLLVFLPHSLRRQEALGIDYPIFYAAANHAGAADGYIYPPFLAWILYPLGQLPVGVSSLVWYLLTAAIFVAALWDCLPPALSLDERATSAILAVSLVATAWLALLNAELGQVNGVVLCLILVSAGSAGRSSLGAFSIGLASALKISPVLVLPYLLMREGRRWMRALFVCLGTAAAALALPFVFGYSFAGIANLKTVSENATANLGFHDYLGAFSTPFSAVLLLASLVVAYRARKRGEIWYLPVLLMMVLPPFVRKAHLIYGMPLMLLLRRPVGRQSWIPLLWALGALGTMAWGPSAVIGNTSGLGLLLWDLFRSPEEETPGAPASSVPAGNAAAI